VRDVLLAKMAKRGVDARFLEFKDAGEDRRRQDEAEDRRENGVESDLAKKIVKLIKDNKLKVQASIQGDVCASPAPRKTCRAIQPGERKASRGVPLKFDIRKHNFRETELSVKKDLHETASAENSRGAEGGTA
jgi:uncharacterized protein YajQ (UPF0234 family)